MKRFKFEDKDVKIEIIDNEIWFVADDVTDILGFDKVIIKVIKDHVDKEDYRIYDNIYLINESGLYNLIFASNRLIAMKFKKWIISKVLPTIRKNIYEEKYENINKKDKLMECNSKYIELLNKLIECDAKYVIHLQKLIEYNDEYIKSLEKIINKKDDFMFHGGENYEK